MELSSVEQFDFDLDSSFTLAAWVFPEAKKGRRTVFAKLEPPEASFRGYTLQIVEGFPALYLLHRLPDNLIMAQAKQSLEPRKWYHVAAVYDGSAAGRALSHACG